MARTFLKAMAFAAVLALSGSTVAEAAKIKGKKVVPKKTAMKTAMKTAPVMEKAMKVAPKATKKAKEEKAPEAPVMKKAMKVAPKGTKKAKEEKAPKAPVRKAKKEKASKAMKVAPKAMKKRADKAAYQENDEEPREENLDTDPVADDATQGEQADPSIDETVAVAEPVQALEPAARDHSASTCSGCEVPACCNTARGDEIW